MIVIVCIDDEFGMLFNQRRQSRDCILTEDILKTVGDKRLLIDKFSKTLFYMILLTATVPLKRTAAFRVTVCHFARVSVKPCSFGKPVK